MLPHDSTFREHQHLRVLGKRLHEPNLWHLNRRSVAGAVATALFVAWLPIPGQMLVAAIAAVMLKLNLPISVAGVWITNPITIPPMSFVAYQLGAWVMGRPAETVSFELSFRWLLDELGNIGLPILVGAVILGVISALLGHLAVRLLWRLHVVKHWRERKKRRRRKPQADVRPSDTVS